MRSDSSWNADVLTDRFMAKIAVEPNEDGCWIWTGASQVNKARPRYGARGVMTVCNQRRLASHIAWYLANGKWPDEGLKVLHHCDNPTCVNPDHLYLGTQSDNMKDCVRRGRHARAGGSQHKKSYKEKWGT